MVKREKLMIYEMIGTDGRDSKKVQKEFVLL